MLGLRARFKSELRMYRDRIISRTNYGFIITRRRQDDSSVSDSPTLSVPLAEMQEALRVCLQFDLVEYKLRLHYIYTSQDDKITSDVQITLEAVISQRTCAQGLFIRIISYL